ncbi:MAG TPA: hypothetical protein VLA16_17120, partial [Ideonella sp.]|nr:hypothetical protein [Ideonella sp.]
RPRRPGALAAMALLLGVVGAAAAWLALRGSPATLGAVTTPPQPLTMQDGVEDFPAYSADGRRLAYTWQGAEGPARIRIDELEAAAAPLKPQEIIDPDGQTLARPVWLGPRRLAYVRAGDASDCRVFVIELDSGARRNVAACYYARGQPVLDASPDGQWLAMARHGEGSASVGIVLHRLADGHERVLTRPAAGFDDAEIAWSHDGTRIAFLRSNATVGDLYLLDLASGATRRLTRDEAPVGGLTWAADDSAIVFNSARGGSFATWRLAPGGGEPALFARVDTPLNLAAVPGQPQAVAASVHRFSDHIELYRLSDGQRLSAITSSGRDLYGQACPSSQQVLFNSLRSGRVELWRSDGQGRDARRIEMPPGIPEPAACLAGGSRFATSLRPPGAAFDQLVFGDLGGGPPQLYSEAAHFTNLTWGLDGRSAIVASDRGHGGSAGASTPDDGAGSDWDLWRFELGSRRLQRLTDDHASFGREVELGGGRWLYYARLGQPGLWRRALAADGSSAGPPQAVTDRLATDDWGNWLWHAGALWLVERAASEDRLLRLATDGSAKTVLALPRGFVRPYSSLSIGDDGVALLTVSGPRQADIMRIGPP